MTATRAARIRICTVEDERERWKADAICSPKTQHLFFPPAMFERKDAKLERELRAVAFCARCPVMEPCLEYALANREADGVWGGLTPSERRSLLA